MQGWLWWAHTINHIGIDEKSFGRVSAHHRHPLLAVAGVA
jgi:hypothetical protein